MVALVPQNNFVEDFIVIPVEAFPFESTVDKQNSISVLIACDQVLSASLLVCLK